MVNLFVECLMIWCLFLFLSSEYKFCLKWWRKVIKGMGCRVRLLWLGFRHQCFLDELLWARPFPSFKIQPPSEFKKNNNNIYLRRLL